jgi:hypothetical protein
MYLTWSAHRLPSLCRVCCLPQATKAGTEAEAPCPVQPLIDRARAMFSGGAPSSGPKASGEGQAASAASDGLLVDAVAAIAAVMKRCKRKGRRLCGPECSVHVQCEVLDKEEMLGYLLGDVLGLPLLPKSYARSVGEAARLRATKAATAVRGDPALRSRVVVELQLPSKRQCHGAEAAAVKHAPPPPAPPPPTPLEAWCARHETTVEAFEQDRLSRRIDRAVREREWRPRGEEERAALMAALERGRQAEDTNRCWCQGHPRVSFLCPVASCYASAAGFPCEERAASSPGEADWCPCMMDICQMNELWDANEPMTNTSRARRRSLMKLPDCPGLAWSPEWWDPPPGGQYGEGFCPMCAGDSLTSEGFKALRAGQKRRLMRQHPSFGLRPPEKFPMLDDDFNLTYRLVKQQCKHV